MNDILKVNSKTDILEFKRKHNLLVEEGTIKANVTNIKSLSNDVINNLRCGDVVLKEDSTGKHAYLVSFKSDTGLCLTYVDASCVETQSYDKSGENWVYNSEDKTIIAEPQMENIVDAQGHKRFFEGEGDTNVISGVTYPYNRYSLSGTHLMFVLAGNIANGTTLSQGQQFVVYYLPDWILNKIRGIQGGLLEYKNVTCVSEHYNVSTLKVYCDKISTGVIIVCDGTYTAQEDVAFRIQLDLLIDNE